MHDPAEDEFIATARQLLAQRVSDVQVSEPGDTPDDAPLQIGAHEYAYEAALLMRMHTRSWLVVHDADTRPVGFVTADSLGDILGLVDASPYFGEALMAELLPGRP